MGAAEQLYDEDDWDDTWDETSTWNPESPIVEDERLLQKKQKQLKALPALKPSQFTSYAFWMPKTERGVTEEGEEYERVVMDRFTFDGRRHMIRPYDTPAKRLLLFCGRQVEKSTLLGNIMLSYMCLVSGYRALYVSPSMTQTKTFSSDRIREPMETSPVLSKFTTTMLSQNILEKQLVNRSKLTLRYAYLNADRTRGIPAYLLAIDEFQDILQDNVPVMQQCLSHAPQSLKREIYSGTPKSLDNHLEYYRANLSTQGEWVVPCNACNHWNVLGEKNIGKNWLCCEKCGKQINPMDERAQWANMVKGDVPWESYRIPQLMVPWLNWKKDILYNYENYSREKFYNEVLGISYDSGLRPLTTQQLKDVCNPDVTMMELGWYKEQSHAQPIYAGLDWGTGEHSYTLLTLGTYVGMKFRVFYAHRFTGEEIDPEVQIKKIIEILRYFNVKFVGSDYGGGFNQNYILAKTFGALKLKKFQYLARSSGGKVKWDPKLLRYKVSRTEVMSDVFNAVKQGKLEFPKWDEWHDPYGQDMLNIYSEHNAQLNMIQYKHGVDKPDDTMHSVLYCFLASMFDYPRPDIITPDTEDQHGRRRENWPGPIDQGGTYY
jgi:hypothetical protein